MMRLLAAGAALLLAACGSGIGEGTRLTTLEIVPFGASAPATSVEVIECLRTNLSLFGRFNDNTLGDFSSRAEWTSSNPAVVTVSNGDVPVPGVPGAVFSSGTLTPVAPGTAVVTAEFVGLTASVDVTVEANDTFAIEPLDARVIPGSTQFFRATTVIDGVTRDVTTSATWSLSPVDISVATIGTTNGVLSALQAGGPFTVTAEFVPCGIELSTSLRIQPAVGFVLDREFAPGDALIVGNTEKFRVRADFGDGPEQDVTGQALLTSSDLAVAAFRATDRNLLQAIAAGTTTVSATVGDPAVSTNSIVLTTVAATLEAVAIAPLNPSIGPLGTQQFTATGTYDGGSRTQDITRHVAWTSSDNAVAVISNQAQTAGLAVSLKNEAGTVTIKAENNTATVTKSAETTLTIAPIVP